MASSDDGTFQIQILATPAFGEASLLLKMLSSLMFAFGLVLGKGFVLG